MRKNQLLLVIMMLCSIGAMAQNNNTVDAQLSAADKKIVELRAKIAELKEQNRPVLPITVLFNIGKATIDDTQTASVEMIADYIKKHPGVKIQIRGYMSTEKEDMANPELGSLRANTVKNELITAYGIDASQLTAKGMGATDKLYNDVEFNRVVTFADTSK